MILYYFFLIVVGIIFVFNSLFWESSFDLSLCLFIFPSSCLFQRVASSCFILAVFCLWCFVLISNFSRVFTCTLTCTVSLVCFSKKSYSLKFCCFDLHCYFTEQYSCLLVYLLLLNVAVWVQEWKQKGLGLFFNWLSHSSSLFWISTDNKIEKKKSKDNKSLSMSTLSPHTFLNKQRAIIQVGFLTLLWLLLPALACLAYLESCDSVALSRAMLAEGSCKWNTANIMCAGEKKLYFAKITSLYKDVKRQHGF